MHRWDRSRRGAAEHAWVRAGSALCACGFGDVAGLRSRPRLGLRRILCARGARRARGPWRWRPRCLTRVWGPTLRSGSVQQAHQLARTLVHESCTVAPAAEHRREHRIGVAAFGGINQAGAVVRRAAHRLDELHKQQRQRSLTRDGGPRARCPGGTAVKNWQRYRTPHSGLARAPSRGRQYPAFPSGQSRQTCLRRQAAPVWRTHAECIVGAGLRLQPWRAPGSSMGDPAAGAGRGGGGALMSSADLQHRASSAAPQDARPRASRRRSFRCVPSL